MRDKAYEFNLYVRKAIRNKVIDFYQKESLSLSHLNSIIDMALLSEIDNGAFFDAQNTFNTTYFENINLIKALNKLSSDELELIELTILKGYQDRELARLMEIKENTLTRRKNRILAKIKKFLEE